MKRIAKQLKDVKAGDIMQHPEFGDVKVTGVFPAVAKGYAVVKCEGNINWSGRKESLVTVQEQA